MPTKSTRQDSITLINTIFIGLAPHIARYCCKLYKIDIPTEFHYIMSEKQDRTILVPLHYYYRGLEGANLDSRLRLILKKRFSIIQFRKAIIDSAWVEKLIKIISNFWITIMKNSKFGSMSLYVAVAIILILKFRFWIQYHPFQAPYYVPKAKLALIRWLELENVCSTCKITAWLWVARISGWYPWLCADLEHAGCWAFPVEHAA